MDLTTRVGGVCFETPLLLGSGYITETPRFFLGAKPFGCASMVTRTLKVDVPPERSRVPVPRYVVPSPQMMLNCEWGNEKPWTSWRDGWVEEVRASGSPIIVSMSGRDLESCLQLIRVFDQLSTDAYEVNISCSHSGALHGNLNVDVEYLQKVLPRLRQATRTPLWVKLSYSTVVVEMAQEAERQGADAIVCTNSIGPGLFLDVESTKPKLGIKGGAGGLTGFAIFPIALRCVYEISQAVRIPVVGVGGISKADHVLQMMMAGASAVQLYTAPALRGPRVYGGIRSGLLSFLRTHPTYNGIADLIGISHRWGREHTFEAPRPEISAEKCTGCRLCELSCAFEAIDLIERVGQRRLAIINDNCISCNACVGVCPPQFGAIRANF